MKRIPSLRWMAALAALAAALPYLNTLSNGFVWDDRPLIVQNHLIRNPSAIPRLFTSDFFGHVDEEVRYGYYRPLVSLSYMADFRLWGTNPFGYHLTNILLHAMNTLLVFLLVLLLFPRRRGTALAAAILFAVHPVHAESVAWIAGRTDLIATLFMLAALLALGRHAPETRRVPLAVSLALFACALLAKETAVVFPAVAAAFLLILRPSMERGARRRCIGAFIAVLAGYGILRFGVAAVHAGPRGAFTPLKLILSSCGTFLLYARMMVFPFRFSAYITNPVSVSPLDPRVCAGAALLIALVFAAVRTRRSDPPLAFALAFALISFLPLMNLVRISSPDDMGFPAAERFLYTPSVGLIVAAAAWACAAFAGSRAALSAACVFAAALGGIAAGRNAVWRDEETLLTDALASSPGAPLLWNNLGIHYSNAGRHDDAVRCFGKAIAIEGDTPRLLTNLAAAKRLMGKPDEAVGLLNEAIAQGGEPAGTRYNLGLALRNSGDSAGAERELKAALAMNPQHLEALTALAELHKARGNFPRAEACCLRALEIDPVEAALWSNLGVVYRLWPDRDRAEASFRKAIALDPRFAAARANLGALLAQGGKYDDALRELSAARELDPSNMDASNALGVLYVRLGRAGDAERLFSSLIAEHPADKEAYLNLGVMRYGEGNREEAARLFRKALDLAPDDARARSYVKQLPPPYGPRPPSRKEKAAAPPGDKRKTY